MPLSKSSLGPRSRWVVCIPATLFLLASATAVAADDAKAHYQKATAHFAVGEYHDAAVEYEEAFKLKQDPAILFNAAQAFRLAGDNQKALLLYNNIIKLYPSTQYAKDSRERIEKLSQAAPATTTAPPAATAAPVAPIPPPAPVVVAPPPAIAPAAPAPGASATLVSPRRRRPPARPVRSTRAGGSGRPSASSRPERPSRPSRSRRAGAPEPGTIFPPFKQDWCADEAGLDSSDEARCHSWRSLRWAPSGAASPHRPPPPTAASTSPWTPRRSPAPSSG